MKAKIAGIGLIATIALTGVATAKTNTLTGAFLEDPPSKFSAKVVLNKDGKPKTLKSISATFTQNCVTELNGDATFTESVETKSVPGSFKIKNLNGTYRFEGEVPPGEDNYSYTISGKVDNKGKHAVGSLVVEWSDPQSETSHYCNNQITNWKADK